MTDENLSNQDQQSTYKTQSPSGSKSGQYVRRSDETPPPAEASDPPAQTGETRREYYESRSARVVRSGPGPVEYARRITVFAAGIIQAVIGLRILFLLLAAQRSNGLVAGILNLSQVFVAPFQGVLSINALSAAGSTLDLAAIVALIGWTLLEALLLAGIEIFRRQPSVA